MLLSTSLTAARAAVGHDSGEAPVILVVGDSLSAAYNLAEEQGWVALLSQRMEALKYPHRVVNASVGGATTAAALQRFPVLVKEYKPAMVILQIGANDGLQGKPVPYITANIEKLILQAQAGAAQVLLVGVQLPPNFGARYTQPFFQQYQSLATKHQLAYVPFLLEGVATQKELMQKDGLHPTAEAQPIILDVVWPVLQGMVSHKASAD